MAANSAELLRQSILDSDYVLDPVGIHHEFASGMHGRKLDFDKIPKGSQLFDQWVEAAADRVDELYGAEDLGTVVLLSVANGTNRLVGPVSDRLGSNYMAALTQKETAKSVKLTHAAEYILKRIKPGLVVALEDVGTSGSTSSTAVVAAREAGAKRVEALNTWQRRPRLERLEAISAVYNSIIHEDLDTYEPEVCRDIGYCALGWEIIPHAQ